MNAPLLDSRDVAAQAVAPITHIETTRLRVPLARTYRGSHYQMTHRSTVVVRIRAGDGLVGEAYAGDEDAGLEQIERIVRDEIGPGLFGQDVFAIERCWQVARPATFDILRDRRLGLVACAIVDTAIWDALGKGLGVPLWRLWGGYRASLPMICIGGYYDSPAPIEEEVERLRDLGVAGMKLKIGGMRPEEDAARVLRARAAAGDDFVLCVDANQGYTRSEAIAFLRAAADAELRWFEEPCRWSNDRRAMRDVRLIGGVPVCAGQSEFSAGGARDLMVDGAIDVCNFDASWSGGPTEWRRVAAMAHAFEVEMGHHEEPQVAAHLLASIPHGTYVECFAPERDPIWWNLIANRPELRDGEFELPDRPGLGWELDEEFIARYRV